MAKKTDKDKTKDKEKTNSSLSNSHVTDSVAKEFGDGIIINGSSLVDNPREVISLSPALDVALGGGLQAGTLVVLAGQPRTGKTSTALHFAARCQKNGRRVVYLNAENRLEGRNLNGISGLDPSQVTIVQSRRGRILSAQDFLSIAFTYLSQETDLLLIMDSISILSEEREILGGIGTETRGGSGKLVAQFCRLATPVIPVNNHIVIAMAQLYANTSGYGKKYLASMGKKVDYALSTLLHAESKKDWTVTEEGEERVIGQVNQWKVERTPIGPPGMEATSYLRYGDGIDEIQELIVYAEGLSLFDKSGNWYSYPRGDEQMVRGNGLDKFKQALVDNKVALSHLQERIAYLHS